MKDYILGIIICIFVSEISAMLLPKGNFRKYMRLTAGIIVSLVIISPFITADISDLFDIDADAYFNDEKYRDIETHANYEDYVREIYERNIGLE